MLGYDLWSLEHHSVQRKFLSTRNSHSRLLRAIDMSTPELRSTIRLINSSSILFVFPRFGIVGSPVMMRGIAEWNIVIGLSHHPGRLTSTVGNGKISQFNISNDTAIGRRHACDQHTNDPHHIQHPTSTPTGFNGQCIIVNFIFIVFGLIDWFGAMINDKDAEPSKGKANKHAQFPRPSPGTHRLIARGIYIANMTSNVSITIAFFVGGIRHYWFIVGRQQVVVRVSRPILDGLSLRRRWLLPASILRWIVQDIFTLWRGCCWNAGASKCGDAFDGNPTVQGGSLIYFLLRLCFWVVMTCLCLLWQIENARIGSSNRGSYLWLRKRVKPSITIRTFRRHGLSIFVQCVLVHGMRLYQSFRSSRTGRHSQLLAFIFLSKQSTHHVNFVVWILSSRIEMGASSTLPISLLCCHCPDSPEYDVVYCRNPAFWLEECTLARMSVGSRTDCTTV